MSLCYEILRFDNNQPVARIFPGVESKEIRGAQPT